MPSRIITSRIYLVLITDRRIGISTGANVDQRAGWPCADKFRWLVIWNRHFGWQDTQRPTITGSIGSPRYVDGLICVYFEIDIGVEPATVPSEQFEIRFPVGMLLSTAQLVLTRPCCATCIRPSGISSCVALEGSRMNFFQSLFRDVSFSTTVDKDTAEVRYERGSAAQPGRPCGRAPNWPVT